MFLGCIVDGKIVLVGDDGVECDSWTVLMTVDVEWQNYIHVPYIAGMDEDCKIVFCSVSSREGRR